MRLTEEAQAGDVRSTVAAVRRYGVRFTEEAQAGTVRFTVAGVRSEVHRGGSGRHC